MREKLAMKKLTLASLLVLIIALAFASCRFGGRGVQGSGVFKTEKRDLASFKAIETEGAYEVAVACQKPQSFELEGDDNILPLIQTEVRDGVLYVRSANGYNSRKLVSLRITVPDLERLSGTGAGDVRVSELKNDKFEIHATGATAVSAAGETRALEINTTGAGMVDTHNLHAAKANVTSAGAASVDVYASEQLDVNVAGAGEVTYSGDPKVVNKHVSGAASVTKKGMDSPRGQ
jgi:hypothetical protein